VTKGRSISPHRVQGQQSAALRTHIGRSKTRIVAAKSRLTDPKIAATRRKTKTGAYFSSLLKIESSHTIDIGKFVLRHEIDPRYMDVPYYITPTDKVSQEAFAVIREAMRETDVVGIGRVVISRRERMIMLAPFEKGMLGTVLRYGYEVRAVAAYFDDISDIALPDEMKSLAKVIIDRRAGSFDPTEFTDRYEDAVADMVRAKQAGSTVRSTDAAPNPSNVIDLMEALRKSIGNQTPAANKIRAAKGDVSQIPAKTAEPSKARKEAVPDKKAASGKKRK